MLICAEEILIIIIIIITIIIIVINTIVKLCHNRSQILRSIGHVEGADQTNQTNLQNDELTTKNLSLRLLAFLQHFTRENTCLVQTRISR